MKSARVNRIELAAAHVEPRATRLTSDESRGRPGFGELVESGGAPRHAPPLTTAVWAKVKKETRWAGQKPLDETIARLTGVYRVEMRFSGPQRPAELIWMQFNKGGWQ